MNPFARIATMIREAVEGPSSCPVITMHGRYAAIAILPDGSLVINREIPVDAAEVDRLLCLYRALITSGAAEVAPC